MYKRTELRIIGSSTNASTISSRALKTGHSTNNELFIINLAAVTGRRISTACTKPPNVVRNFKMQSHKMDKEFKLRADQIIKLIEHMGACIATDKITIEGEPVDYMVREEPDNDFHSGWQFFSGTEDQEYIDNPNNSMIYEVNTIANYDKAIIPYLKLPIGTQLERIRGTDSFQIIPG